MLLLCVRSHSCVIGHNPVSVVSFLCLGPIPYAWSHWVLGAINVCLVPFLYIRSQPRVLDSTLMFLVPFHMVRPIPMYFNQCVFLCVGSHSICVTLLLRVKSHSCVLGLISVFGPISVWSPSHVLCPILLSLIPILHVESHECNLGPIPMSLVLFLNVGSHPHV